MFKLPILLVVIFRKKNCILVILCKELLRRDSICQSNCFLKLPRDFHSSSFHGLDTSEKHNASARRNRFSVTREDSTRHCILSKGGFQQIYCIAQLEQLCSNFLSANVTKWLAETYRIQHRVFKIALKVS